MATATTTTKVTAAKVTTTSTPAKATEAATSTPTTSETAEAFSQVVAASRLDPSSSRIDFL